MGDSLSAEYGIRRGAGWVNLLNERLAQGKFNWRAINASISGETTSGGLARLTGLLDEHHPGIVIVELGANDGLRGLRLSEMKRNLAEMIVRAKKARAKVVLVDMRIPPNYGRDYASEFERVYSDLGQEAGVTVTPFFFEGFADRLELFQSDRIHPIESAQARLLDNVWPTLKAALEAKH